MFGFGKKVDVVAMARATGKSIVEICCYLAMPLPDGTIENISTESEAYDSFHNLHKFDRMEQEQVFLHWVEISSTFEELKHAIFWLEYVPNQKEHVVAPYKKWIGLSSTLWQIRHVFYEAKKAGCNECVKLAFEKWERMAIDTLNQADTIEEIEKLRLDDVPNQGKFVDAISEKLSRLRGEKIRTYITEANHGELSALYHKSGGVLLISDKDAAVAELRRFAQCQLEAIKTYKDAWHVCAPDGSPEQEQARRLHSQLFSKAVRETKTLEEAKKLYWDAYPNEKDTAFQKCVDLSSTVEELTGILKWLDRHYEYDNNNIRFALEKLKKFFLL